VRWLWIMGILIALLLLLLLTRVAIRAAWHDGTLTVDAKLGLLWFSLVPQKEKPQRKARQRTDKKGSRKAAGKPHRKPTFAEMKHAFRVLAPYLKRALQRTQKGVRIHPLRVSLTLGGREDPAAAAEHYGALQAAVWTVMPEAERLLDIPDPYIHIGMDFEAAQTAAEADAGISIRIGTLLAIAFGVGIPALRLFLQHQKEPRTATPSEAVRT